MNTDDFRRHGHEVVEMLAQYLEQLPESRVWTPVPDGRRQMLRSQVLPRTGADVDELLAFAAANVLPHPFGNGHPRFFAWGNPAPALEGVLFEFIAAAMNPSCAGGDHAAIYLEECTVRWLADLISFDIGFDGGGVLLSGGAAAALTGLSAARRWAALRDGWDDRLQGMGPHGGPLRMYVSNESHASVRKAAHLLGLGDAGVRVVPTDADGRMDIGALDDLLAEDRGAGLRPFCVVATAGVVSTGVVDDLESIADRPPSGTTQPPR